MNEANENLWIPTLMEYYQCIVGSSGCSIGTLMPYGDSINDLKQVLNMNIIRRHEASCTLLCPVISPVEAPVSIKNACPNLSCGYQRLPFLYTNCWKRIWTTDLSRPSPTAIIRLLSPSHSRSLLCQEHENWTAIKIKRYYTNAHILPEMTLYSPFSIWSSPTVSHTRTLVVADTT